MILKKIITSLLLVLGNVILSLVSWLFWDEILGKSSHLMAFLLAPRLEGYPLEVAYKGEACWVKGRLATFSPLASLQAPLTQAPCLYYSLEKRQAVWEKDSDGDQTKVWYLVNNEVNHTGLFYLETLKDKIEFSQRSYFNFEGLNTTEKIKMIDGKEYKFVEKMLPLQNEVWVFAKLQEEKLWPVQDTFVVSLNTPEAYLRILSAPLLETAFFLSLFIGSACFCLLQLVITFLKRPPQFLLGIRLHLFFIFYLIFFGTGWLIILYQFSTLLGLIILGVVLLLGFIYLRDKSQLADRRLTLLSRLIYFLALLALSLSYYLAFKFFLNLDQLIPLLPLFLLSFIISLVAIHLPVFLKKKSHTHLSYDKPVSKPSSP